MTQTERLILENQIAIMSALREIHDVTSAGSRRLHGRLLITEGHLNESEQDGGH